MQVFPEKINYLISRARKYLSVGTFGTPFDVEKLFHCSIVWKSDLYEVISNRMKFLSDGIILFTIIAY